MRLQPSCFAAFAFAAAALAAAACDGAHVEIAFGQLAPNAAKPARPQVFGAKLVAAYLAEDVDPANRDNIGHVARIWTNPVCDDSLTYCGIGPQAGAYQVRDYFDFALPQEEVNANLNAQPHEVKPGTYRWVRIAFTGAYDSNVMPNLRFGAGETISEVRLRSNVVDVALDPPLVLSAGDAVTVRLGYDITDAYYPDAGENAGRPPNGATVDGWYCAGTGDPAGGPCLYFEGFTPTVETAL